MIRRAIKIYPAFWLLILVTVGLDRLGIHGFSPVTWGNTAYEPLFVQNYRFGLWNHTWSLAVEEHFYLLLSVGLLRLTRICPAHLLFRRLTWVVAGIAAAAFTFCFISYQRFGYSWFDLYAPTHHRLDPLAFGVFLAGFYHLRKDDYTQWARRGRIGLRVAGMSLVSTCLFLPQNSLLMVSAGLCALYVGFGILLFLALSSGERSNRPIRLLAFMGRHSYSIYLWHMPILLWIKPLLRGLLGGEAEPVLTCFLYLFLSLLIGILASRMVEMPVLRLRDRPMTA